MLSLIVSRESVYSKECLRRAVVWRSLTLGSKGVCIVRVRDEDTRGKESGGKIRLSKREMKGRKARERGQLQEACAKGR